MRNIMFRLVLLFALSLAPRAADACSIGVFDDVTGPCTGRGQGGFLDKENFTNSALSLSGSSLSGFGAWGAPSGSGFGRSGFASGVGSTSMGVGGGAGGGFQLFNSNFANGAGFTSNETRVTQLVGNLGASAAADVSQLVAPSLLNTLNGSTTSTTLANGDTVGVPEPASMALFAIGLAALAVRRALTAA